ncbi:tryptophan-rich sensory protein [Patescibacteria group bacterium]|nr:tryptophan-rich sensory protein [Patescibacteria group bacterium]
MRLSRLFQYGSAILICEAAGFVGSFFTTPALAPWYASLTKPAFTPPGWIFGPVWIALYALMGVAVFWVWEKGPHRHEVRTAVCVFGAQLLLNVLWSLFFFGAQNPLSGLVEIAVLWGAIVVTIAVFAKISRPAAWLLVPYLAWVSFAAYLNFMIWFLNRV